MYYVCTRSRGDCRIAPDDKVSSPGQASVHVRSIRTSSRECLHGWGCMGVPAKVLSIQPVRAAVSSPGRLRIDTIEVLVALNCITSTTY